jgi:phosphogluconate dehydratase
MGGPLARVQDGDILRVDAEAGVLENLSDEFENRPLAQADLTANGFGMGRELFDVFRQSVGPASEGASSIT